MNRSLFASQYEGNIQCEATVSTSFVLCIGLTIIWIIQLQNALHALHCAYKPVPLAQLLSSYEGYKAFMRFLVGELSIENLEFFQLSMRWRYRICCWLYGVENGTKEPEDIKLPFKIFSFQFVDRLLPMQQGGGLVLSAKEQQELTENGLTLLNLSRDSGKYFATLPMSRKGI